MSLNRGLWLSVGVAFAYVALRRALQGNIKLVITIGITALFIFGALAVTTLGNTVQQRFEIASESNATRSQLYQVAFDAMKARPLVGYGGPINGGLWRDVGTHGLVWFVMVAYGLPGLVLLLLWMITMFVATIPASNPVALFTRAIVVFIIKNADLRLQPQLALVGIAAGLGYAQADAPASATPWRRVLRGRERQRRRVAPGLGAARATRQGAARCGGDATARSGVRLISSGSARSAAAPRRSGSTRGAPRRLNNFPRRKSRARTTHIVLRPGSAGTRHTSRRTSTRKLVQLGLCARCGGVDAVLPVSPARTGTRGRSRTGRDRCGALARSRRACLLALERTLPAHRDVVVRRRGRRGSRSLPGRRGTDPRGSELRELPAPAPVVRRAELLRADDRAVAGALLGRSVHRVDQRRVLRPAAGTLDELTAPGLPSRQLVDAKPYNGFDAPDMPAETRAELTERFRPEVDALSAMLGRDLPWLGASAPRP